MNQNKNINSDASRREDQKKVMAKIEGVGHCPFCQENLFKYHKKPILKEGQYWILTDNQWPYDNIKHQLLAIYKKHIDHFKDIDPEAGAELFSLFQEEIKKRNIPGGGIAMRFGSNLPIGDYGTSVYHLHVHLVEPDLESLSSKENWKFKFGQRF
jgi:diadenosine tetraphosphate (Ap4A) HIT family hydrolase